MVSTIDPTKRGRDEAGVELERASLGGAPRHSHRRSPAWFQAAPMGAQRTRPAPVPVRPRNLASTLRAERRQGDDQRARRPISSVGVRLL